MRAFVFLFVMMVFPGWIYASSGESKLLESDTIINTEQMAFTADSVGEAVSEVTFEDIETPSLLPKKEERLTLYDFPYSRSLSLPNWKNLWINTSILVGGGVTTLIILQSLPMDATAWNKHENSQIPLFDRYVNNIKAGPVWDDDNPVFNYVLHPYAGAAYFMGARGAGFNFWGSFLYSFCISTFFWEYGFEAFNEIPSVQDLIITPVIGSLIGEGFYLVKRKIVENGYRLCGSRVLGYAVAFLVDPLNELTGYFRGDQKRLINRTMERKHQSLHASSWIAPSMDGVSCGISLTYNF